MQHNSPLADELDRAKDLTASTLKATEASEVSEFDDELDSHSGLSTVEENEDEIPSGTSVTGKDANEGDFETTTSVLDSVAPSTTAAKTTGETSSELRRLVLHQVNPIRQKMTSR